MLGVTACIPYMYMCKGLNTVTQLYIENEVAFLCLYSLYYIVLLLETAKKVRSHLNIQKKQFYGKKRN